MLGKNKGILPLRAAKIGVTSLTNRLGTGFATRTVVRSEESKIGPTLRSVRIVREWTQQSLAFRLGISIGYLRQLELGRRTPGPKALARIEDWLAQIPNRSSR